MAHNISFETLVDYAEGRLSEADRASVTAHLQTDLTAAAQVADLQHLFKTMRNDDSIDAPTQVINRAGRLLRQRRASLPPQPSLLRRLVAALTFDSASSLALGTRSGASHKRQMLFSAEGMDLDVRITTNGDEVTLSGQVLGPESNGSAMLTNAQLSVTVLLNEMGEYTMPSVPAGRYTLTLLYGDAEIVMPELELGASNR
jgi:hypothetical protein